MDVTHLGLRQKPFPATPDGACYYPATTHEQALARLEAGLADGEGVLLLTGLAGTGKTLLAHLLIERLGQDNSTAFLTNSHCAGRAGLLQSLLFDLGLPYEQRGEQEMRLALTDHLIKTYVAGRPTIVLADEAHHFDHQQLEELRLLGNLETSRGKMVQVVLSGQPTLLERLREPSLVALRQRVAVRAEIEPLDQNEAADYMLHHLRVAGGRPESLFLDEALQIFVHASGGIPRLLNLLGRQALALVLESETAAIDAEVALETARRLDLDASLRDSESEPTETLAEDLDGAAVTVSTRWPA